MAAVTLAEATGGRFVLGLGVSHPHLADQAARPRLRPAAVAGCASTWTRTGPPSIAGPRPTHDPPPVLVAALRERMTDLAATDADGAFPYLVTPERVAWMRARLDAAAPDAARCWP